VGVVAFPVEGTVLHVDVAGRRGFGRQEVLLRSRPGPHSRVAPMPVEGSAAEKVRGVGITVVGAVPGTSAQGVAGSHSVAPVLGMAEQ
jgi:hypothetical protein